MNNDIILSVENVSKEYQLGTFSAGTFGGDVQRWWYKMRGKEDPFTKIGTNDRSKKTEDDFVLALQDINFEVKKGEVLGIIGKNGAGKSTLLKLLSRVTSPTTGSIKVGGRMASLLEVGTGFHPELTGLENIYLNGAILGMTKAEVKSKLDEIIEFSGCAQYIDTPVKRYSSGMRVRLGFAVAAFLEPEILVVDEVLAVGDAEFQKKAIGKMQDISKGGGRTVLFVSHNMASISTLCTRCVVLENGTVSYVGDTDAAIDFYLKGAVNQKPMLDVENAECLLITEGAEKHTAFKRIKLLNHLSNLKSELLFGKPIKVLLKFEVKERLRKAEIGIHFTNPMGIVLGGHVSNWNGFKQVFEVGEHEVEVTIPFLYLFPGRYYLSAWIKEEGNGVPADSSINKQIEFTVFESNMSKEGKIYLERYKHLNLTVPSLWK